MCVNLVLLAKGTALDVAADEGGESGPPEFGGDQLSCFQEAGMAGRFMIMAVFEDGAAKGVVGRDVDTAFVGKDAGLDLPVSEPGTEGKRNVLMHGLESLEDEGITCGCGFNAMGEGSIDHIDKKGWREEGYVGIVGVIRGEEVRAAGEGIRSGEELSRDMDHFQVEVSEVNKPTCLASVKRLGLSEIGKVFMVGEDLHRERRAMEVVPPRLQGANDSEKLAVIDIVIPFGGGEGLRQVGTWVPVTIGVGLEEDGA